MRRTGLFVILPSLLWLGVCGVAHGAQLHWDDCNSYVDNRPYSGPGIYRHVVTGGGFTEAVRGYSIRLHMTASNVYDSPNRMLPAAWRFDVPNGCQAGQLDVDAVSPSCPSLAGDQASISVEFSGSDFELDITLVATFEPVQPDRFTNYSLFELAYDHARSAAGPQDPSVACGQAEQRMCFVLRGASWIDTNMQSHPMFYEPYLGLSWQDEGYSCFGDLPVLPSRWTAMKALYR